MLKVILATNAEATVSTLIDVPFTCFRDLHREDRRICGTADSARAIAPAHADFLATVDLADESLPSGARS